MQCTKITSVPAWIDIRVSNTTLCSTPALHPDPHSESVTITTSIQSIFMTLAGIVYSVYRLGLDVPGIKSRWCEISRTCPDQPWGPPSLLYNGYRVFSGGKASRNVALTTHPHLAPRLKKGYTHTSTPPLGLHGLFWGELHHFYDI
jgi:hypothetical protein